MFSRSAFLAWILIIGLSVTAFGTGAWSAPAEFTADQRQAIEAIVKDYLVKNPDLLLDALQAAEDKIKSEAREKATASLSTKKRELYNDPESPIGGNPNGDVSMVEFFDYRCPYCKQVVPALEKLLGEDHGIRFIYKEFPVLGPDSKTAARAALAARKQGKYEAMHRALMALKGQMDEDAIMKTAGAIGLDVQRLRQDMGAPEIDLALRNNLELAETLDVHGTPAFVIGDEIVPGAISITHMKQMIEAARRK